MDWEIWGAPLAVLAAGLVAGLVLALTTKSNSAAEDPREILLARKEQLMEQLRALETERAKLGEAAYVAQKTELVAEAAEVLRKLEAPEPGAAPAAGARREQGLWVVALVFLVLGVGAVVLARNATPRQDEPMTGGTSAGGSSASASAMSGLPDDVHRAMVTLESNPEDLEALNVIGHYALVQSQLQPAMQYIDAARKIDPTDPEVEVHVAALQILVNMHDRAVPVLESAIEADPDWVEPKLWLGLSLVRQGDEDGARAILEEAVAKATDHEEKTAAQALIRAIDREPPTPRVSGTVQIAQGATPATGATLFVYARSSEVAAGPPRAALKFAGPSLPLEFTFTDESLLMGGDWPEQAWISARLDADGDPMTREDADLQSATIGPIGPDSEPLALVLGGDVASEETFDLGGASPHGAENPHAAANPHRENPHAVENPHATNPHALDPYGTSDASEPGVTGTLKLAAGATPPPGGILFIYARPTDATRGMPLAAKKIPSYSFPLSFEITEADLIQGGSWPAQVWISARIDADGEPMSRSPEDLTAAVVGPIGPGEAIELTLE